MMLLLLIETKIENLWHSFLALNLYHFKIIMNLYSQSIKRFNSCFLKIKKSEIGNPNLESDD
jgi:hypothetical protein